MHSLESVRFRLFACQRVKIPVRVNAEARDLADRAAVDRAARVLQHCTEERIRRGAEIQPVLSGYLAITFVNIGMRTELLNQ